ncbi:UNVERIFIED_CONTAM: hypothetical protein Cloal_1627 [Acetivibrio alkalicellulosi]
MISSITKDKISPDYVFVLKTSQFEKVLADNNIDIDVTLIYWKPQIIGSVLEVYFWLPNDNVSYNRLYVRAGVLLKKDIILARALMVEEVLPNFIEWFKGIEMTDKLSNKYKKSYFNACLIDDKIHVNKD